jgi:hypothetical protein
MPRIELGSHAYKAWALTNMRHSRDNELTELRYYSQCIFV